MVRCLQEEALSRRQRRRGCVACVQEAGAVLIDTMPCCLLCAGYCNHFNIGKCLRAIPHSSKGLASSQPRPAPCAGAFMEKCLTMRAGQTPVQKCECEAWMCSAVHVYLSRH